MRLLLWMVSKALRMGSEPPDINRPLPPCPTVGSASVSAPENFPASAPARLYVPRINRPQRSEAWPAPPAPKAFQRPWAELPAPPAGDTTGSWPAQPGIATYADTRPGAVVLFYDDRPAPTRIVVGQGGDV